MSGSTVILELWLLYKEGDVAFYGGGPPFYAALRKTLSILGDFLLNWHCLVMKEVAPHPVQQETNPDHVRDGCHDAVTQAASCSL